MPKEIHEGYTVLINNGRVEHAALSGNGAGRFFSWLKQDATRFAKELKPQLPHCKVRVAKCKVHYEWGAK